MSADTLLSKLDKLKRTGKGTYIACCPAHDDKRPSMGIRETDDGRVLVHCFGQGCSAAEIVAAVGLELADLFPPRPVGHLPGKPERRPFPATDALRAVAFEATVVLAVAAAMMAGEPFDRERLAVATGRIAAALSAAGLEMFQR